MRLNVFLDKLEKLIEPFKTVKQTQSTTRWEKKGDLVKILCKPLLSHDIDPNGEECEESIKVQDELLHIVYTKARVDRAFVGRVSAVREALRKQYESV